MKFDDGLIDLRTRGQRELPFWGKLLAITDHHPKPIPVALFGGWPDKPGDDLLDALLEKDAAGRSPRSPEDDLIDHLLDRDLIFVADIRRRLSPDAVADRNVQRSAAIRLLSAGVPGARPEGWISDGLAVLRDALLVGGLTHRDVEDIVKVRGVKPAVVRDSAELRIRGGVIPL